MLTYHFSGMKFISSCYIIFFHMQQGLVSSFSFGFLFIHLLAYRFIILQLWSDLGVMIITGMLEKW